MKLPSGKGFYVWNVWTCDGGDIEAIADFAVLAGMQHLLIKIADGKYDHNIRDGRDLAAELAAACLARGIEPWGWQYIYLSYPISEAEKAIQRIEQTGMVGFVINAEYECKNKPSQTAQYVSRLRESMPRPYPIGLSSYRFPSLHPELSWKTFRNACDFDLPQVYWEQAHNPSAQLNRSLAEFEAMTPSLPYIPTGSAYKWNGWAPTEGDITEFLGALKVNGLQAVNFWEWNCCRRDLPNLWNIISAFQFGDYVPPLIDMIMVNTSALNMRNAPVVSDSTLVGVTSYGKRFEVTGVVQDTQGRDWYQTGPTVHLAGWLCKVVD